MGAEGREAAAGLTPLSTSLFSPRKKNKLNPAPRRRRTENDSNE